LQKRRWITKAPDVLTFQVLRVVYDHETQMPKKIHDEFSFDKEIFIDRFIAKNASRFPDFMNTLDKLKSKKQVLEESLKKYQHEGNNLIEYLRVTRNFIEKQKEVDEEGKEYEAPDEEEISMCDPDDIGKIGKYEKHLSQGIENEKKSLNETINDLGNAYTVLKEFPYTLHCIVIHEGEDNSGHYYSYIKNHIEGYWYKYDDHRVHEVPEEKVLGEAYGLTKLKTSAYLVMYVSKAKVLKFDNNLTEYDYYMSLIPKDIINEVNQQNFHFNEQLQEVKNKELANEIMEHFKYLDSTLKRKVAGTSDKSLLSFSIFCYKNQELILCQNALLDTAIQEKHPAKLSIECLDEPLENTLLKAFNADIIRLSDQRKKNLENMKAGYYLNFEASILFNQAVENLIQEKYQIAFGIVSYMVAMSPSSAFLEKIFQKK
jgi:hypothetical protein